MDSSQIVQHAKVLEGFKSLLDQEMIRIKGCTMYLFPEIWARDPKAFMANAYRYFRLKLNHTFGHTYYFIDIESGKMIGIYQKGTAKIL